MPNEELQQAIAWFENRLSAAVMPGAREMFGIALSVLREKQEREMRSGMSEQRLIDANALIQDLVSKRGFYPAIVKSAVEQAPTVPAEVIVHCRDCKYKEQARVNKKGFLICPTSGMEITDDDFCSYGERRESEESK